MRFITLALLLLLAHLSYSQILNVNKAAIDADTTHLLVGSIDAKFEVNNLGTKLDKEVIYKGLDTKADLLYIADKHGYILINKLKYYSSSGGAFISTGYSHFRANFNRKNKVSLEAFAQAQYDDGRNMSFRWLTGAGIRINLLKTNKSKLDLGIGAMHESEEWKTGIDTSPLINKSIWKTTNYIRGNIAFNDNLNVNMVTYYQGGPDGSRFRSRLISDTNLNVVVIGRLSFITTFSMQYDFDPIIPIVKYYYSLTNGLKFDF